MLVLLLAWWTEVVVVAGHQDEPRSGRHCHSTVNAPTADNVTFITMTTTAMHYYYIPSVRA